MSERSIHDNRMFSYELTGTAGVSSYTLDSRIENVWNPPT
jgi:hypothetical protein